jgi:deazaflavin-dependent oxidoreductase (nitroreductase family)
VLVTESPFLYLTTIGRRSGLPREIEIWFTERGGRYYVIAETRDRAHWVRNIVADPRVRFRVADRAMVGTGRIVDAEAEPELNAEIRALSRAKYGWGDGLVVELSPTPAPTW